jgi:ATP-dependent Clp protease ATP-binding subunit ClpA
VTTWLDEQYNPEAGARSIDRLFLEKVEPVLISAILEHPEAKKLRITRKDDTIAAIPVTDTDGRGTGEPV